MLIDKRGRMFYSERYYSVTLETAGLLQIKEFMSYEILLFSWVSTTDYMHFLSLVTVSITPYFKSLICWHFTLPTRLSQLTCVITFYSLGRSDEEDANKQSLLSDEGKHYWAVGYKYLQEAWEHVLELLDHPLRQSSSTSLIWTSLPVHTDWRLSVVIHLPLSPLSKVHGLPSRCDYLPVLFVKHFWKV